MAMMTKEKNCVYGKPRNEVHIIPKSIAQSRDSATTVVAQSRD